MQDHSAFYGPAGSCGRPGKHIMRSAAANKRGSTRLRRRFPGKELDRETTGLRRGAELEQRGKWDARLAIGFIGLGRTRPLSNGAAALCTGRVFALPQRRWLFLRNRVSIPCAIPAARAFFLPRNTSSQFFSETKPRAPRAKCNRACQGTQRHRMRVPRRAQLIREHAYCPCAPMGLPRCSPSAREAAAITHTPQVRMQGKSAGHCEDPRQQVAGALPFRLPPRHNKSHPVGPACLIHMCPYILGG